MVRRSVGRIGRAVSGDCSLTRAGMCGGIPGAHQWLPACLWDLDAPGLPSRVVPLLGKPFGLSTPGGEPVAVCCPGPLLLVRNAVSNY